MVENEKRINFILQVKKDDIKKELSENKIIIKNNNFKLSENEKTIVENYYNYSFNKNSFSVKNKFLFNAIKDALSDKQFITEKELNEKLNEKLNDIKQELLSENENENENEKQAKKN